MGLVFYIPCLKYNLSCFQLSGLFHMYLRNASNSLSFRMIRSQ